KAGSESDKDDDDNDDEEELAKNDDEDTESDKGGDEVSESEGESDEEETRQEEEESFNPIPRTPEGTEDEGSDEEDQELRLNEEARIQEEEEADELYRDVNINQGRGLQVTQNIKDSHVTLTPVHPANPDQRCRGGIHFHDGIFSDCISSNTKTYNNSFHYCYNNYIKRCTNPSNNNSMHNSRKSFNV
nr:hypothetical protein [Tanacetum cinerariifolium]